MRRGLAAPASIVVFFYFSPLLPAPCPPSPFLADHAGCSRRLPMKTMPIPPAAAHGRRAHPGRISPFLLALVFLVLSISRPAAAQPPASGTQNAYGTFRGGFGPALGVIIVLLISALFFMVFFSVYLRQCGEHADNSSGAGGAAGRNFHGARSRRPASRGLDPAVVQAFPTLVYAEVKEHKIGKGALECAVCLCEFDDEETLRLLPKCDHVFHTDCIDAWLSSHTTCPVCRSNLAAAPEGPEPSADDATASAPAEAGASSGNEGAREPASQQQGDVVIVIDEAQPGDRSLGRTESKNRRRWLWSRSLPRFPRSHSTGHSLARRGEDRERFTLRLPAHIRRDVMAGKFQRSSSFAAVEGGGRNRRSHREAGEGSGRGIGGAIGGRSYKMRRWEGSAKSDRWAFFSRTLSMVVSRGENDAGEGPSQRAEGSSRGGGGGEARREGSTKGKVFPAA